MKEAAARIKINKLLEAAGWRFFSDSRGPANIQIEPSVALTKHALDDLGENFEKASKGFIDFLLLNEKGFPFIVLEAKAEDKNPLVGKEQARKYAKSQNCRFVMLSNGNLHYFWDLERGKGLIGFGRDEKTLIEATSPFAFSIVPERTMLRFLKLIACDNAKIGTYVKLVDNRNNSAHPNGNIYFSTRAALDTKIIEILRVVDEIQGHSKPVIQRCYREFLLKSHDPDEREYSETSDQIREALIHANYMSQRDIGICLTCNLGDLRGRAQFPNIEALHQQLHAAYSDA